MTIEPWLEQGSRVSFEDEWLKVVTTTYCAADGTSLGDFHALHYPDWVNVVALTPEGQVVLVREYRQARRAVSLGLPGGAMNGAGETPLEAAQRELREETGYTASSWIQLGVSAVNAATHTNALWSFLALEAAPTVARSLDSGEDIEVELAELGQVLSELGRFSEVQSLHLATLLHAFRFVLSEPLPALQGVRASLLMRLDSPG